MGRKTAEYDTTGAAAPSAGNELASWTYDTLKKGKPTASTRYVGGTGGTAYTNTVLGYDSHGWTQATELVVPSSEGALAGTYLHQNQYNLTGTLSNYTDQDPSTVKLPEESVGYTYDAFDRPISVGGNNWSYVNKLSYTEFDEPYQFTYGTSGNFAQQTLNYDDQTHRLASSTTITQSGAVIADKTTYAYQPFGNVTKITDKLETGATDTQCFDYDWAQRLKTAWTATDDCAATPSPGASTTVGGPSPYWQSWSYDATGARSQQIDHDPSGDTSHDMTATYTPYAAGKGPAHAVAQVDKVTPGDAASNTTNAYTYDDDGNVHTRTTRAGTDTFTYDVEDNLSELSSTGTAGDTKYLYDADGNLLLRRAPDATTLYTGDEEITLKKGAATADGVRYISIAGETVATHSSDGKFSYLIPDRQGTGTLAIDSQTQQVVRRQYKPFGEARDQSGTWTAGQRGFVGGTQDDNTGLTNLGAREYDPSIGRFLSPDPLLDAGAPQSWNGYDYADDSPVTTSDPSGACAEADCNTRNCPACLNRTPTDKNPNSKALHDYPGSGSTPTNTKAYAKKYKADISNSAANTRAQERALERQKATADAAVAAARKQASGFKHRLLSMVADVIGLTDAYNCFTKGDVMGCISTALNFVPWGKVFKAIKVGVEAFKVWRALDRAYTAVKDAEEAAKVAEDAVAAERFVVEAEGAGAEAAEACAVHSFVPDTGVRLADGSSKPISKVKVGDTVLATDPQTGVTAPEKVQAVIVTKTDRDFTTLTLDTAPTRGPPHKTRTDKSAQGTLTTTWHHPFWDVTRHRWTDAHDLTPGAKLRQADGTTVTVAGVHNFHQQRVTYDLTVQEFHTYYVRAGVASLLVHNCSTTITARQASLIRPGPHADESVAATGADVTAEQSEAMQGLPCHSCGSTAEGETMVGDHQPATGLNPEAGQRLYPQCPACSSDQSRAVLRAQKLMRDHFNMPDPRAEGYYDKLMSILDSHISG